MAVMNRVALMRLIEVIDKLDGAAPSKRSKEFNDLLAELKAFPHNYVNSKTKSLEFRLKRQATAIQKYATEPFELEFSGAEIQHIEGWENLSKKLLLSVSSLKGSFAKGKGQFVRLVNTGRGADEVCTIRRLAHKPRKPKREVELSSAEIADAMSTNRGYGH